MDRNVDELIAKIEQAFSDVPFPGDDDLTDSAYGDEPAALIRAFRGRTDWKVLSPSFLDQAPEGQASALSFFSARAFLFYLPSYLIADLKGGLDVADPSSRLCTSVTPQSDGVRIAKIWGGGTLGERARESFALFDPAQVSVIVSYLWWKLASLGGTDPTIEQALENYWSARDAGD